jgi:para-nitrobenzyl esterase
MKTLFVSFFCLSALLLSAQDYCNMNRFDEFIFSDEEVEVISNVTYGEALNNLGNMQDLKLDIYRPKPAIDELTKKPLIFFVHGGGLVGGSKDSQGAVDLGYLYAKMGYVYVSIDYRIGWDNGDADDGCGGDTTDLFRATYRAVQDVRAAYRFVKGEAEIYGIDTNAIFVEGNSAGSRLILFALYASQSDYNPQFYDELGSIDTAVNAYTNYHFNPIGVITEAGGIEDTSLLYNNNSFPHLYFHGTCDSIVPFFSGPTFFCYDPFEYPNLHGSWQLVQLSKRLNRPYQFYIGEGAGHDAVIPDSIILYAAPFIKDILCNTLSVKEFYRVLGKYKCAVANEGELVIVDIYPNPVIDNIYLQVTSTRDKEIEMAIYNELGQAVLSYNLEFHPPIKDYQINIGDLPRGIYYLRISQRQEIYVAKFFK